ncbi:MAG: DEAD/DEAH box helicase [Candidatus Bathyarchaeia archaeon]|nr:DEAD/DEAH box helicase [Candidatus Bathyarchaeota archaeon A05DMB-4]MDH7595402.1 DEAD/DEAH box helicase [Candidatus Bathyarchaeota archaeon]
MSTDKGETTVFDSLVKPIRRLIEQKAFLKPTEPQAQTIPKILEGKNVLLISPTATGKTEAAILPVFNMLVQMPDRGHGIKVLYVTPLRALNRDLLERLEWWCNNLDIRLAIRHGDTEQRERARQTRSPPDVLITTPETLQAILSGWILRQHLQQVRWVIIDEVHEMADSKRGSQLSLALERLRMIARQEFQLIGLSATIGSPKEVAQFLVGNGRPVEIVRVPVARMIKLQILFPQPMPADYELASSLYTHPEVAARLRIVRDFIEKHKSVLLFTNTRTEAEVLTSRFKVWDLDFPVSIHHGSLAKPSRIAAERGLKEGGLRGLICTSSLELGIDVGRIDLVIQYMSPRQVTRLIQRVGRSGHRIGHVAKGVIITMDSDDTLEALVIARMAPNEELEPVTIPPKPYDVLAHQIAGLLMNRRRLTFYEVFEEFRKAYPFRDLTEEDIQKIFAYMHSRFPRLAWVSEEDKLALKPRRSQPLFEYYFDNLSMIPVEKQYLVIDNSTDSAVGVLDEAFVAEFGKPGLKFIIRGSPWKIVQVYGDKIHVKPVDDPSGAIPSWVGEEIPVPFEVAQEVGWIRGFVEDSIRKGETLQKIVSKLAEKYPADEDTIMRALRETFEQVKKGFPVPTDKRLVVEDWEEFVILHANFGLLANRALAQLLGQLISERTGYVVTVQHDPYRIFIQTMGTINGDGLVNLFNEIKAMPDEMIREQLTRATVKTGLFKRRMIHVARRFGALKKWVDFSNVSLRSLMKSFEGTVIFEEALKETFTKDLDMEKTIQIINNLRTGEIEIQRIDTGGVATPVARVGIERVSMKTDLIPPEKMRALLVESAKARLLNETRTFVCTNCWDYSGMIRIKELPDKPLCPKCGSSALGVLRLDEDQVQSITEKKGEKPTKKEEEIKEYAKETARLVAKYGKPAAVALSARRVKPADIAKMLKQESTLTDNFYEAVLNAEKKALKKRFQ